VLRPEKLSVWTPKAARGPLLQGGAEALVALLLEGRIQSGIVTGKWGEEATILGYYQPAPPRTGGILRRRITGGWEARASPETGYAAIVFASESLEETAELAKQLAEALGAEAWGATRMGPRTLGAGVIEVVGPFDPVQAVEAAQEALGARERGLLDLEGQASKLEKAYIHPGWAGFTGAEELERLGVVERPPFHVRIGLAVREKFIASARIDGVFMAAPPAEPYSTIASIQGMPAGEQAELILAARFGGPIELYGVTGEDVVEAFRRALGGEG